MLRDMMNKLSRFSISLSCSSRRSMSTTRTTTTTTQVQKKLVRQGLHENPQICYHQLEEDESISFRCGRSKKAVSWASSTVDNELTPRKSFQKEPYFAQVFEVNRDAYMGLTAGSMQMRLVKRT